MLDAVEADDWFDGEGNYIGRDVIGIGIQGRAMKRRRRRASASQINGR